MQDHTIDKILNYPHLSEKDRVISQKVLNQDHTETEKL